MSGVSTQPQGKAKRAPMPGAWRWFDSKTVASVRKFDTSATVPFPAVQPSAQSAKSVALKTSPPSSLRGKQESKGMQAIREGLELGKALRELEGKGRKKP